MRFSVVPGNGFDQKADALVFPMTENFQHDRLDKILGGALGSMVRRKSFLGKPGQIASSVVPEGESGIQVGVVVVVGLGKADELSPEAIRKACAIGARRARSEGAKRMTVALNDIVRDGQVNARQSGQSATEGVILGLYRMDKYKKKDPNNKEDVSQVSFGRRQGLSRGPAKRCANRRSHVRWNSLRPGPHQHTQQ